MLDHNETPGFDRAGILAVLSGVLLCALAAALPLALMPKSQRCAQTHLAGFCDEIAGLFGAKTDPSEAP